MTYCVDTSSILEAYTRSYPPSLFPRLWNEMDQLIENGHLVSSEEVLRELEKRDDEVFEWAKARASAFLPVDDGIQIAVREILASHPRLMGERANRNHADPFVIGTARAQGLIVVTEEDWGSDKRPRIPLVCDAFGIECMTVLEMMQREDWVFG